MGPHTPNTYPFLVYGCIDLILVLACCWWLSVAVCGRVQAAPGRSLPLGSTHPLYFDAAAHAEETGFTVSLSRRTVTQFDSCWVQTAAVTARLLLLGGGVLITLQAVTLVLGGFLPTSQLRGELTSGSFAVEAAHALLLPLLLLLPLSWTLALGDRRRLTPRSSLGVILTALTLLLAAALLAAGVVGILASHGRLQPSVRFGITVWHTGGEWALGGLQLSQLPPLVLALYTTAVGLCLWWRTGWWVTVAVQLALLAGHFAVVVNRTAAFFVPPVWEAVYIASLLHTDWMVWRADAPLAVRPRDGDGASPLLAGSEGPWGPLAQEDSMADEVLAAAAYGIQEGGGEEEEGVGGRISLPRASGGR